LVNFASNDYLGLSAHPRVIEAAQRAAGEWGTGAGASRLVTGTRPVHERLEESLASYWRAEAAVVFATGYQANLGVLATLGAREDAAILSDRLNHASIIDGARLAKAPVMIYEHCDVDHAAALLREARSAGRHPIVVTDLVFSMDGDTAPIQELGDACAKVGALLVVDVAHAVLGPDITLEDGRTYRGAEVLVVGTLSKYLGSLGGFVCGAAPLVQLLVNRARSLIYTTALSPCDAAAALAALEVLEGSEGRELLAGLRERVDSFTGELWGRQGWPSPIVPVVVGDDSLCVELSGRLESEGFLVPAIRPPTVPEGTARLRVSLSSSHAPDAVVGLARLLRSLGVPNPSGGPGGTWSRLLRSA
jgi:8-amino-7-oxononanoate synthase